MAASTHAVTNQPPPLTAYDVFGTDPVLVEGVERHLDAEQARRAARELTELGRAAGSAQAREWGRLAQAQPPVLRTHDRFGHRIDEVEFAPAWHRLLGKGVGAGLTSAGGGPGGRLRRAAAFLVWSQVEPGHLDPLSTTYAAVPALRARPDLAELWEPRLTSAVYESGLRPVSGKAGALLGLGLTEKQGGGEDPEAVTTRAEPVAGGAGTHRLTGHKWFCSAPMSDGFLVVARAAEGPTCFLVPRVLDDGTRNVFALQRLKDTLGHRANATAEVEFDGTWAHRIGDEGRAVATLRETVAAARLDRALGAAALMRQAVAQAVHHCTYRTASGVPLAGQPLMRNVLADLALESEAATTLVLRLAAAHDRADAGDERERALLRLAVPAAKYWLTKRCTPLVAEALECLGGNGYVEDSGLPALLRAAPAGALREGPGNVQALEALRVLQQDPAALDAFLLEAGRSRGADHRLDAAVRALLTELGDLDGVQARARRLVERIALVLQGSLLVRYAPPDVADAFCAARLGGDGGAAFGTLPHHAALAEIVERARPVA
ncbi:DNA alkylation response protein [Streptomyces sp. SID5785]|uniref:acyl-CoA dehydrogenase family protein n=1 Tax=Streptomyces sp. SID5785 TaxID=2690309 RepID=UPI001361E39B|nr:acyl-CoA dehydrogenase family protein [Streptomyces sp. SID5785]MZD05578.1 DNA alkylation response protein [Streptomyces sp. SID5785]